MLSLALESSSRLASAALGCGDEPPLVAELAPDRAHLSGLMPLIATLFERAGRSPHDLDAIFVGTGPGSYTGLRVGISIALGLAVGPGAPKLYGVPSPEALLRHELADGELGTWLADARAGTWYRACAQRSGGRLEVLDAPALLGDDQGLAPRGRLFTDAASLERCKSCLPERQAGALEVCAPHAMGVLDLGLERVSHGLAATPPDALAPLYLREFAARVRAR